MSELLAAPAPRFTANRAVACLALAIGLLWAGWQQPLLFGLLTRAWNAGLAAVGLGGLLARLQQGASSEITKSSIPAMLTGSLAYMGGCLLLLHLLLRSRARTQLAAQVYLALLGACLLLVLLGKVLGVVLCYRLARRLIDLLVSPLPVMLLLPVLWPREEGRERHSELAEE